MAMKEMTMETGMEMAAMNVERISWRNRRSRNAVRVMPSRMLDHASSTDAWMNSPESLNQLSFMPPGSSPLLTISSKRLRAASMTLTALESPRLTISSWTAGLPSR